MAWGDMEPQWEWVPLATINCLTLYCPNKLVKTRPLPLRLCRTFFLPKLGHDDETHTVQPPYFVRTLKIRNLVTVR